MINNFSASGEYDFLSNFYFIGVEYEGMLFASTEHAFQAAKTLAVHERRWFQKEDMTPGQAKRLGRKIQLRPDWETVKLQVMADVLRAKFKDPELRAKLLATGTAELVEGNDWGDCFWGVCRGVGENHLGKSLMRLRLELAG